MYLGGSHGSVNQPCIPYKKRCVISEEEFALLRLIHKIKTLVTDILSLIFQNIHELSYHISTMEWIYSKACFFYSDSTGRKEDLTTGESKELGSLHSTPYSRPFSHTTNKPLIVV